MFKGEIRSLISKHKKKKEEKRYFDRPNPKKKFPLPTSYCWDFLKIYIIFWILDGPKRYHNSGTTTTTTGGAVKRKAMAVAVLVTGAHLKRSVFLLGRKRPNLQRQRESHWLLAAPSASPTKPTIPLTTRPPFLLQIPNPINLFYPPPLMILWSQLKDHHHLSVIIYIIF